MRPAARDPIDVALANYCPRSHLRLRCDAASRHCAAALTLVPLPSVRPSDPDAPFAAQRRSRAALRQSSNEPPSLTPLGSATRDTRYGLQS